MTTHQLLGKIREATSPTLYDACDSGDPRKVAKLLQAYVDGASDFCTDIAHIEALEDLLNDCCSRANAMGVRK